MESAHQPEPNRTDNCTYLDGLVLVGDDLVDDHTGNPYMEMLTQDTIQFQFIKRGSKSSVGHQYHVSTDQRCYLGIVQSNNGPDGTMSRPFNQYDIAGFSHIFHCPQYLFDLFVQRDFTINKLFGVSLWNDDWRHVLVINVIQFEMFPYLDAVTCMR